MKPRSVTLGRNSARLLRWALFLAVLVCTAASSGPATNDFFGQGVAAYRAGQLPEAAEWFERAQTQQPAAGMLDDLGITEWQRGHAGAAILAWERARWIDPFDARARLNLEFARQVTQLDEPRLNWYESASTWLPAGAWLWMAGVSLWLVTGAWVLPRVFRRRTAWHETMAAVGFCLLLFSLTANLGVVTRTQIGFVVSKDAPLLLTPTPDGEVISTLTEGEPARKLRSRGHYLLVRTGFGAGWIRDSQLGLICP